MNTNTFSQLGITEPLLSAIAAQGYETPTPIQTKAIPSVLNGRDLLGIAQTGTGKTAAFALPILQKLLKNQIHTAPGTCRALIVAPTRELAAQIAESFESYSKGSGLSLTCVFGGVGAKPQIKALARGVDILIATPGRLLDHVNQHAVSLKHVEIAVLDEADRMLDMGFIRDIKRIVALLPASRQTLLFSATMPPEILAFANPILKNPERAEVESKTLTADRIEQMLHHVPRAKKAELLISLLHETSFYRTIVFTKTKHGANKLAKQLSGTGLPAEAIHANKSQNARTKTMANFKSGDIPVLVATDLASRGIDVDGIDLVVNFDLPNEPETYVHRIGRTARAGASGKAIAFCDETERKLLKDIERFINSTIPVMGQHHGIEKMASVTPTRNGRGSPREDRGNDGRGESRGDSRNAGNRVRTGAARNESRGERSADGRSRPQGRNAARGGESTGGRFMGRGAGYSRTASTSQETRPEGRRESSHSERPTYRTSSVGSSGRREQSSESRGNAGTDSQGRSINGRPEASRSARRSEGNPQVRTTQSSVQELGQDRIKAIRNSIRAVTSND